jgi:hypothetical protein
MKVLVRSIDTGPTDLEHQLPFQATLLREIAGRDRPDYWLAQLDAPLRWAQPERHYEITHIILATRAVDDRITADMRNTGVGIAYVIDMTLLQDEQIDFSKCSYVAIGFADAM